LYLNEKQHQNEGLQHSEANQTNQINQQDNTMDFAAGLENAASIAGGLFDLLRSSHRYDEDEADNLRAQAQRRKKKKDHQYKHRL
jgi:hypothetical protein